ncbi:glutathione S-transferase N-terminal domain-containing protein [Cellvibrio mixtus]|uniref:glutathione S-transferase N-terminal domain-containing protein n=1 Tax=Cellvibrio mixtus TaxID=39650 RepID=UPI0005865982|nr:glutathione S-transferase N-terminal domain-containing protein [Cellvibrio mixtus]
MNTDTLQLIQQHFPPKNPARIQLYSMATPNGQKASIMLEELGWEYDVHKVDITKDEQFHPAFLAVSPNNKIPAMIDPQGLNGELQALFESGAILLYLAEKSGKFAGRNAIERYQAIQWLMFQMGGIGPMFGQVGFFHKFAGKDITDPRPKERYVKEAARLLGVLDKHLREKNWVIGAEFTIADIAIFPWVSNLLGFYEAGGLVGIEQFPEVTRVLNAFLARPAVQRGMKIPA